MKEYVIVAPKYSKSNGVRTLYRLADHLNSHGMKVYMFAPPPDEDLNYNFLYELTPGIRENAIVIYPEVIYGNPLNFKNVVRYVLYYPGILGGEKEYSEQELVFTFDRLYYDTDNILSIPCLDRNLFYKDNSVEKTVDCYFVRKGGKWRELEGSDKMIEINSEYPETRQELADLLRKTKTLYSYDDFTLLLDEAIECGCNVKIIRKEGLEDYKSRYEELFKDFDKQIENFIAVTQNLNYTGVIEKRNLKEIPILYKLSYFKYKLKQYIYFKIFNNIPKACKYWFKAELKLKLNEKERKRDVQ